VLYLHEVHTVAGRHDDDFEAVYRDRWMPQLATDDGTRLLWFLRQTFATGRAYQVVTITALADGAAYERLARRVQTGDLRGLAAETDTLRHAVRGKLLLPVDWSPVERHDLDAVPVDARPHDPTLFLEDSAWPHEGMLDRYLDAARTHYAPSLERRDERSLLTLEAVWQAAPGAPRRDEVVLWQRVDHPERLPALFGRDLPAAVRAPGTWMHDALAVRDDWESKLLRTATWSPLH
jgi:hypothetical protein